MTGTASLPAGSTRSRSPDPGGSATTDTGPASSLATGPPIANQSPPSGREVTNVDSLASVTEGSTERSYAAAVRSSSGPKTGPGNPPSRHGPFIWPAEIQAKLDQTLARDWNTPTTRTATAEVDAMRSLALHPSPVHADATLRATTPEEKVAFMAYLRGELEIPHPPNFLKATMPVIQRAAVEQYHELHLDGVVTADIPPQVQLRRNMPPSTLIRELLIANQDVSSGQELIKAIERDMKSIFFDGNRTLTVIFPSKRLANYYQGITIRLQRVVIDLDLAEDLGERVYSKPHLRRRYAVRILGAEALGLATVIGALANISGIPVLDAERPRDHGTDASPRHYTVRFEQDDCPAPLRGVTRVWIGSKAVTLHHHLVHYRPPCNRCLSPRHTTGHCKLTQGQLKAARNRSTRKVAGPVVNFEVGSARTYWHTDEGSLDTFWQSLIAELPSKSPSDEGLKLERLEETEGETAGRNSSQTSSSAAVKSREVTTDGDFTIVKNRAKSTRRQSGHRRETKPAGPTSRTLHVDSEEGVKRSDENSGEGESQVGATQDVTFTERDAPTHPAPGHSYGQYQALMEDGTQSDIDSGSDMDISSEEDQGCEEADYAFPDQGDPEDSDKGGNEADSTLQYMADAESYSAAIQGNDDLPRGGPTLPSTVDSSVGESKADGDDGVVDMEVCPNHSAGGMDVATPTDSETTGYVGSSAPTLTPPPASTPGSEFPYSLASADSDLRSDELAQSTERLHDLSSQDSGSVIHELTNGPARNPVQAQLWLSWFDGKAVQVPENGQCAMLALYATVANHPAAILTITPEIKREVAQLKRAIYALLIANLRADCALDILDPLVEVARLYPDVELPRTKEVALALLCTHMAQERLRTVDAHIPGAFWADPNVLRTYAQYLRMPLIVLDVNAAGDAHAQLYTYTDHEVTLGGAGTTLTHETGQCTALTDAEASDYLNACGRLHVLPLFMLLKHHERHFYGVQHGETFFHWQAQGDPTYAKEITHAYDWMHDCLADHPEIRVVEVLPRNKFALSFAVKVRGMAVELREDTDEVNSILHKGLTMRQRLDVAHYRMGWPILDDSPLDQAVLVETMEEEEEIIHLETGLHKMTGVVDSSLEASSTTIVTRFKPRRLCRISESAYRDLLQAKSLDSLVGDRGAQLRKAIMANDEAFSKWYNLRRPVLTALEEIIGELGISTLVQAPCVEVDLIRNLFGSLPYPELAAKCVAISALTQWGRREAYLHRLQQLESIVEAKEHTEGLRAFCSRWISGLTRRPGEEEIRRIEDTARWKQLLDWLPSEGGIRPLDCSDQTWAFLHILPHVVRHWRATAMGMQGSHSLAQWYTEYPPIRTLCREASAGNWGLATKMPTGLTWEEQADTRRYPAGTPLIRK